MASISQLSALQELLDKSSENETSDDEDINFVKPKGNIQTPGHIGPAIKSIKEQLQDSNKAEKQSENIWVEEEVPECDLPGDDLDERIVPEYDMLFKQKVTSEDIFLGVGNKNPSTACCEDLVAKIYLPETKYSDVNLNVTDTFLDCQTPKYKLGVHFPHRVDHKSGKAQWDSGKGQLTVTVPLRREYDFLNVDTR